MNKILKNKLIPIATLLIFSITGILAPLGFAFAQYYNYPALSVSVYADRSFVNSASAEIITYTINYQNYGSVRANNVIVTNDFDENYLTVYDPNGGSVSGGIISWNIGTLDPGQSGTKSFRAQIRTSVLSYGTTYIYDKSTIDSNETNPTDSNTVTIQYVNNYQNSGTPSVNLKVNGSDGPISVPYNTPVVLTWTSNYVSNCYAAGDWSGNKSMSGTENLGYITSSKYYNIICTGPNGTATDNVSVTTTSYNPAPAPTPCYGTNCAYGNLTIEKTGVNTTTGGTGYSHVIVSKPGDVITFQLKVTGTSSSGSYNTIVKDSLPSKLTYLGRLTLDGSYVSGDIVSGVNLGNLSYGQTRVITFQAQVAPTGFSYSQTKLTNTATVSNGYSQDSDSAVVCVNVKQIIVKPTYISTGITDNIFVDSFIIPLALSLLILWLFKSRIVKINQWRDKAKESLQDYKTKRLLDSKIAKIKRSELN